jgi:hypothetical protein
VKQNGPYRRPNKIEIFTDHAEIVINSKKYGEHRVVVDTCDVPLIENYRWYLNGRYIASRINIKNIPIHHFILPPKENYIIDHINRNTLDNRRCNLRYATGIENSWNRFSKNKQSVGASYNRKIKKWQAIIVNKGEKILIDSFDSKEDCLMAYDFVVGIKRGKFSLTNNLAINKDFLCR